MLETGIDHIDNIKSIDRFFTTKEYLNLPQLKDYVNETGIVLPETVQNVSRRKVVKAIEEVKGNEINASSIIIAICGLFFVVWSVIGRFLVLDEAISAVFQIYDGSNLIGLIEKMIGEESVEITSIIATSCLMLAVVMEIGFGIIGAMCDIKANGIGIAVKIGTFIAFVSVIGAGIIALMDGMAITGGMAISAAITLMAFFVSVMTRTRKKSVKENG